MEKRIQTLLELSNVQDIYPAPVATAYDRIIECEPDPVVDALKFAAYMQNQTVVTEPQLRLPGMFRFNGSFRGDLFQRPGYPRWREIAALFYLKPYKNFVTFEWEHSVLDYKLILENGLDGLLKKIEKSEETHAGDKERLDYLRALKIVCNGMIAWCERLASGFEAAAKTAPDAARRRELTDTAAACRRSPRFPAQSFREAITAVSICFHFNPDSIGLIDRYLYPYYTRDLQSGKITKAEAKSLLQEFFINIKANTPYFSGNAGKGGESHFALGGYGEDMNDCWNELSELILESLLELPMCCPQISLRHTKKTPFSVLYKLLDYERRDSYKRIAFVADEPRIEAFTKILGLPLSFAVNYTTVGCNETAFPGGVDFSGAHINIVRSVDTLLNERRKEFAACATYKEFFALFQSILKDTVNEALYYQNLFNAARSKDIDVISSLFMPGCIESAKSATQGGAKRLSANLNMNGLMCVIDSISIIKQLVYDEKRVSAQELCELLDNDWGDGELRAYVLNRGKFFGNNDEHSESVAISVTNALCEIISPLSEIFGHKLLVGCFEGYNPHSAWFGAVTPATPDGRKRGEPFMIGVGQWHGRDKNGLTSLLLSVAHIDPSKILTGSLVFNVALDPSMVQNDEKFLKTAALFETFLNEGGVQFQVNHVSRETLLQAEKTPENYGSLRVRVSGFSAYYTKLFPELRNEILKRTEHSD